MTLASYISCLRIALIVPIIYLTNLGFWEDSSSFYNYFALFLFIFAGITDYLDGYIARKTNTETQLGALLDLVADKLLVSLVMVWMVFLTQNLWIVVPALVIVSRELVISMLRQHIIEKIGKNNLSVSYAGKSKTTIQLIAIGMLILAREVTDIWLLAMVSIWFAAAFSLYSLFIYVSEWSKDYLN